MKSFSNPFLIPVDREGSLIVRHYRDETLWQIRWKDFDQLQSLQPAPAGADPEFWIAPGLLDLQINGYGGVDLQSEAAIDESELLKMVAALRLDGCHRIFLTLITSEWTGLIDRVRRYRAILQRNPELLRAIVGWHIEGPFISSEPGFSGAHNPVWMQDASPRHIQELREVTAHDPVILTLAPERTHSIEAIAEAVRCGFIVSLGHTNATSDQVTASEAAGARAFTHLGNGCPQLLDRHQNILWNILDSKSLTTGIIPDRIHVSPPLFRLLHRALPAERIYWTTDAIAAAGSPPGEYTIGNVRLSVGEDLVVRNPVTQSFAGSALRPIEGIRRGAQMLSRNWREVWDFFSVHPAKLVNLPAKLAVGSPFGFCLLRTE